jgi:hypothetical protein
VSSTTRLIGLLLLLVLLLLLLLLAAAQPALVSHLHSQRCMVLAMRSPPVCAGPSVQAAERMSSVEQHVSNVSKWRLLCA